MTLFENRMHALSSYFEAACIAGPWSADTVFDYQLSTLYSNCERMRVQSRFSDARAFMTLVYNRGSICRIEVQESLRRLREAGQLLQHRQVLRTGGCPDVSHRWHG